MPLMVKSRRRTSSWALEEKRTSVGMAAVEIGNVAAIRSNLGDNFLTVDVVADQNHAEMRAYSEGAGEQGEDRVGVGTGGDIEIRRRHAEKDVADTASGKVRLVTGGAQLEDDALSGELCRRVGHCNSPLSSWHARFRFDAFEPRWDSDDA